MRIVAKIGTSSVTDGGGRILTTTIATLSDQVAALVAGGHEVVVVSSGAVAAGISAIGLGERPSDMATLQALSAAGQSRLMGVYDTELGRHGLVAAQVLLDPHDFVDRRQYLHARQTLLRLWELGCIPVVNENDAVANEELRYGDNDRLAALVAHTVGAELLVLLTDRDGLYTADPEIDPSARLIERVGVDDPRLSISAGASTSGRGSGGMASKLEAARIASWSGVRTVIARASEPGVLDRAIGNDPVGTVFDAHDRRLPARKLWIAFASRVAGRIVVDEGAHRALVERRSSLLPAGVIGVEGAFGHDDTVDICTPAGVVFARGMTTIDSDVLGSIAGRQTRDLPEGMIHEVVHRDDLVVLPG